MRVTIGASPLLRNERQFKSRQLFYLPQKYRRLHPQRAADIKDTSQRWVCFAQFDEADEGAFVARPRRESFLAHLLPQAMLPQQLSERCGRIEFRSLLTGRGHTSIWHRKYNTRRL